MFSNLAEKGSGGGGANDLSIAHSCLTSQKETLANSVGSDWMPQDAVWSGSTMFALAGSSLFTLSNKNNIN